MEVEFSVFPFILSLREFKNSATEEDVKSFRFLREPGMSSLLIVESQTKTTDDVGIEPPTTIHFVDSSYQEEEFETVIFEAVKDAFEIFDSDPDEGIGNLQAEEMFTSAIASGLALIGSCPYYEFLLEFTMEDLGFMATLTISKTSFNKLTNSQTNSVLIQTLYPLIGIETENDSN